MSTRKPIIALTVALAGLGAFAAIGLGEEDSIRPGALERSFERLPAHPVEAPSAALPSSVEASAKRKPKLKYFETAAFAVPVAGRDVFTRCPAGHKAVTGYHLTSGGILLDLSAIGGTASAREWDFGLLNLTEDVGQAIVGVVCGKNL